MLKMKALPIEHITKQGEDAHNKIKKLGRMREIKLLKVIKNSFDKILEYLENIIAQTYKKIQFEVNLTN